MPPGPSGPAGPAGSTPSGRPPSSERLSRHAPDRQKGALRLLFTALWLALQFTLVLTADRRPDGAFGFRMFSESSTLRLVLYREVASGALVRVDDGTWLANDGAGVAHRFSWYDRVKRPEMGVFNREISASYGAEAQVERLRAALVDLASHVPDDAETRRFLLEATIRRNGREPYVVRLWSAGRPVAGGT